MEYLGIPFSVKNTPCLQPDFLPFAPWRTAYLSQARQPFRIAVCATNAPACSGVMPFCSSFSIPATERAMRPP